MTYDERVVRQTDERVVTPTTTTTAPAVASRDVVVDRSVAMRPSGGETARRIVVLILGVIQIIIALRIFLLLLDAREANGLVRSILDISQVFVAPFDGIFRTNALASGGSILDVAAIAAFVGWTVLEIIVLWIVSVFRREPA